MSLLHLLSAAVDLADSAQALVWLVAPWLYLLSPRYRAAKRAEWARAPAFHVAVVRIGGAISLLLQLLLFGFVVYLIVSAHR